MTTTPPAACDGVVTPIDVAVFAPRVAFVPPNVTEVTPERFAPLIVTLVPPAIGPCVGAMVLIDGASVTVTCFCTMLPFAVPVAVRVYVVVVVGWTLVDPLAPKEPTLLSIETAETVGFVDHASVDDWPVVIVGGAAVNDVMQPPPTSIVSEKVP